MEASEWVSPVEAFWAEPDGALYRLRMGEPDWSGLQDLVDLLKRIDVSGSDLLPKRFVSVLWYLPRFIERQLPRLDEDDRPRLRRVEIMVTDELGRILGIP